MIEARLPCAGDKGRVLCACVFSSSRTPEIVRFGRGWLSIHVFGLGLEFRVAAEAFNIVGDPNLQNSKP